jgi:hypothetical protein
VEKRCDAALNRAPECFQALKCSENAFGGAYDVLDKG